MDKKHRISITGLPQALFRRVVAHLSIAAFLILFGIVAALYFHDKTYLVIIGGSAYLIGISVLTIRNWNKGRIYEVPVACTGVADVRMLGNMVDVYFVTDEKFDIDLPGTFRMSKKGCPFVDGMPYLLYIDKTNPSRVLAYQNVNM